MLVFSNAFKFRLNFVPAAAVIPWGLMNVFGIGSYIISFIDLIMMVVR